MTSFSVSLPLFQGRRLDAAEDAVGAGPVVADAGPAAEAQGGAGRARAAHDLGGDHRNHGHPRHRDGELLQRSDTGL